MQKSLDYNKFFTDLNIAEHLKVEEDLGSGYVKLKISESERRQALQDIKCVEDIVVELLRNSRDAGSKNIFIATKKTAERKRLIYCIDDGRGIPQKFHKLIFQSRVTSKLEDGSKDFYGFHGRGMALFSIKLNVEDVRIIYSDLKKGTSMLVEVDLEKIPEKKDQSALPYVTKNDDNYELSGGVNNMVRVVIEFALQNKDINFYYGSPTQIIATLIDGYKKSQDNKELNTGIKKIKNLEDFDLNILNRDIQITAFGYYAGNSAVLELILKKFYAMDISFRNVQRLVYGEIEPLKPVRESLITSYKQYGKTSAYGSEGIETDLSKDDFVDNSRCGIDSRLESSNAAPRSSSAGGTGKNKDANKNIRLYDELKLANRFKDEEIRYIINILEKEVINIGSKYFIVLDSSIEFKKINNVITFIVNLKQKE